MTKQPAHNLLSELEQLGRCTVEGHNIRGNDPVLEIGIEIGRLIHEYNRLDEKLTNLHRSGNEDILLENLKKRVFDRQYQLEAAIPGLKPSTLGGALVALLQANRLLGRLDEFMPEPADHTQARKLYELQQDISANLYSAMSVLKIAQPGLFEQCGGTYYMADYLNPLMAMDDAAREHDKEQQAA